jgi:DNA-directed RNA polymerase sigma subunit (sigma70/sigma32)
MKNVIERTNRFYIEMSRKVLSEKEYDVLQKLLMEKKTLQEVVAIYGVTGESVRQIYDKTYKKVKSVTQLLAEIDDYKYKLQQLKYDYKHEI